MKDFLSLGPTPHDEPCAQSGTPNYNRNSRIECLAVIQQIRRIFGPEPVGTRLKIQSNPHDFGTYYDTIVEFDDEHEASVKYAYLVESEFPAKWDDAALQFLEESGYTQE